MVQTRGRALRETSRSGNRARPVPEYRGPTGTSQVQLLRQDLPAMRSRNAQSPSVKIQRRGRQRTDGDAEMVDLNSFKPVIDDCTGRACAQQRARRRCQFHRRKAARASAHETSPEAGYATASCFLRSSPRRFETAWPPRPQQFPAPSGATQRTIGRSVLFGGEGEY